MAKRKKSRSKKKKENIEIKKKTLYIAGIIALIVLIVLALKIFPSSKAAAVVNEETITIKELDSYYNRVPEELKPFVTRETLLEQLINEKVLLQEAGKKGLTATDEQASAALSESIALAGINESDFKKELKQSGLTINDMTDYFKKQLTVTSLLESELPSEINASDLESIRAFTQWYLDELKENSTITILLEEEHIELGLETCLAANGVNDSVSFIYSQSCPHCVNVTPSVEELEEEGYSFFWADAGDAAAKSVIVSCMKDYLSGYAPQFICTKTGETHTGELTKEELKSFIDESC